MTTETEFILVRNGRNLRAGGTDAFELSQAGGAGSRAGGVLSNRVRVVAIDARDVLGTGLERTQGGVTTRSQASHRVHALLFEFPGDILSRNGAVVAHQAIVFRFAEFQQRLFQACRVRRVTIFTTVGRDSFAGRIGPGVFAGTVPGGRGSGMHGSAPLFDGVTFGAQG